MNCIVPTDGPGGEDRGYTASNPQKKTRVKLVLTISVLVACILLLHFSGFRNYLQDVQGVKRYLDGMGGWSPIIFIGGCAILVAVGAPRLVICGIGGFLFGFVKGLLFAQIGSLIGAYAIFLFARWGGGPWLAEKTADRPKLSRLLRNPSTTIVVLIRQLPIYGVISNALLGMANTSHGAFLVGSFLGFLPTSVAATLIGGGFGKESSMMAVVQIGTAAIVLSVSTYFVLKVRKMYYTEKLED